MDSFNVEYDSNGNLSSNKKSVFVVFFLTH